jgi:hypothetical protein
MEAKLVANMLIIPHINAPLDVVRNSPVAVTAIAKKVSILPRFWRRRRYPLNPRTSSKARNVKLP